jgi:adenylate cyclase
VWTYLAAARAYQGRKDDAATATTGLLERYPNTSIEYYRAISYFRRSQDLEHYLAGLKQAGLPQWAWGFQGSESNRLDAQTLREIVADKIWVGRHVNGTEFIQQTDDSGAMAYRSKNTIQTGIVSIRENRLCQRFEGSSLNRELCGYVYSNPQGSSESQDEYIAAGPSSLRYFTVTR